MIAGFLDSEGNVLGKLPFLAENIICLYLDAKWFWRKYTEVDFYHNKTPIEVKYTQTKPDIKNALLATKNLKANELFIITKDIEQEDTQKDIKIS